MKTPKAQDDGSGRDSGLDNSPRLLRSDLAPGAVALTAVARADWLLAVTGKDWPACERTARALAAELGLPGAVVKRFIDDKARHGWLIRGEPIRDPAQALVGFCQHYQQAVARGDARAKAKGEIEILRRQFRAVRKRGVKTGDWSECNEIASELAELLDATGELDACGDWTNEFIIQHERDGYTIDGRAIIYIDRALVAFCEKLNEDRGG